MVQPRYAGWPNTEKQLALIYMSRVASLVRFNIKQVWQTAKNIVVINKDPEASLFEIADFGIVGDLASVLSKASELINARK
jgi:thiamine pyrophosphate-dependent acetolactate synthase large subunit-like protein